MKKQRARSIEDNELKRRNLLDSTRRLFPERGYQGTSIEFLVKFLHLCRLLSILNEVLRLLSHPRLFMRAS